MNKKYKSQSRSIHSKLLSGLKETCALVLINHQLQLGFNTVVPYHTRTQVLGSDHE